MKTLGICRTGAEGGCREGQQGLRVTACQRAPLFAAQQHFQQATGPPRCRRSPARSGESRPLHLVTAPTAAAGPSRGCQVDPLAAETSSRLHYHRNPAQPSPGSPHGAHLSVCYFHTAGPGPQSRP